MRVLVTGAEGFVGRPLCEAVRAAGHGLIPSAPQRLNLENNAPGVSHSDAEWAAALRQTDVVIHLAARVHMMHDQSGDPLTEFRNVNTEGTRILAESAAQAGVRRLIFVSSAKVNGETTCGRAFTEADAAAPEDAYGISKWEAEQSLAKIAAKRRIEIVILRPPLVYGPGVKANFFALLRAVDRGLPLPLGEIHNRRSLIYLGNLVDAIMACIQHPSAAGKTYLVSDGDDVSTPELVRRLAAALGKPARLLPFPPALMKLGATVLGRGAAVDRLVSSLQVDSSKIREELGWAPPYTMQQGLRETADWYQNREAL